MSSVVIKFKIIKGVNMNLQEAIAELTAKYILHYFGDDFNKKELEDLFSVGVKILSPKADVKEQKLAGLKFVLTGTLPTLKRNKATELIEENGGEVMSSVSKSTNFVLAGADAGSKLEKAKALGISIITETEFLSMI